MRRCTFALLAAAGLFAQVPAINQRRVVNAFSNEPAPTRITPGGILIIEGINLGPAEGMKASGSPLPTKLGDPEVEVLVGPRSAALFSVQPNRIVAQLPVDTPNGQQQIVVRRGEQRSRPAFITVQAVLPAVKTKNDLGFGEAGALDGSTLKLSVTGLGATDPVVPTGEAVAASPRQLIRAYVGGLPAEVEAKASAERVGEFDVIIKVPEGAAPGDVVSVFAGNAAPANRPITDRIRVPEVQFARMPQGAGAQVRILRPADLRGNYVVGHGLKSEDGCFPAWVFDLAKGSATRATPECLVSAQANAGAFIPQLNEQPVLAALGGPASGDAAQGISNKIVLFHAAKSAPMVVETPRPVTNIAMVNGLLTGNVPGQQVTFTIDPNTGEIGPPPAGGGGGGGGGAVPAIPGGAGGGAGGCAIQTAQPINLGDGLDQVLCAMNAGGGNIFALVADNLNAPTRAKVAVVNNQGVASQQADLPAGWLPLLRAAQAAPAGVQLPPQVARRAITALSQGPLQVLLAVRKEGADAVLAIAIPSLQTRVLELPSGWFTASCAPTAQMFTLETSRQFVLFGGQSAQPDTATPCNAGAFVVIDPAGQGSVRTAVFPRQGLANLRVQPGGNPDINDYIFAMSSDPRQANLFDNLFVFDSLSNTAFALTPESVRGFQLGGGGAGQAFRVDEMSALVGTGFNNAAGDGGLIYFDLELGTVSSYPVPAGFQSINLVEVYSATRKLVAQGVKEGATGTQYLIYDLDNKDMVPVPNPEGVAFVGNLPAAAAPGGGGGGAPGGGGQPGGGGPPGGGGAPGGAGGGQAAQPTLYQVANVKSGHVTAMAFNAQRQPVGVMSVKVP